MTTALRVDPHLPESTIFRLLGDTNQIARRMTRRIAGENTLPPKFRTIGNLRAVTQACREALDTLVRLLRDGQGLRPGDLDRLGQMGAREAQNGLPLEVLLGAYRIAARVLWEEVIGESVLRNELASDTVVTTTSYVLEYFDLISGAVGSAYLATRERLVLQRHSERDRIVRRLLAGDVSSEMHLLAAAVDLNLAPPYRVIAYMCDSAHAETAETAWRKGGGLVVETTPEISLALVSMRIDVAREHKRLEGEGTILRCVVGPVAERLEDIADSARVAQEALLVGIALQPERSLFGYKEFSPFAALRRDPISAAAFVDHELGSVTQLAAKKRDDAVRTIDAVVSTSSLAEAADRLGIHRHTLVYRVERLHTLGINLQDAEKCHRLWLALRLLRLAEAS